MSEEIITETNRETATDHEYGGAGCHNAGQADNSHLGRAAADIHNHAAHRFSGRQPGTNGGGHRLLDHRYLAGTGLGGGLRTARRSTSVTPDGTQMTTRGRTNRYGCRRPGG